MIPRVRYVGPCGAQTGLAQAAMDYMAALIQSGCEVDIDPLLSFDPKALSARYQHLLDHIGIYEDCTHLIVHSIPPYVDVFAHDEHAPPANVPRITNTVWESRPLPASVAKKIDAAFEHVVVPSKFNRDAFVEGGLPSTKIQVIPHCFDPDWWWYRGAPLQIGHLQANRPYVFLSIGVWAERKNPIGILKAYWGEFTRGENVLLRLVVPNYSKDDVESLRLAMDLSSTAPVEFLGCAPGPRLTDEAIRALHWTSDCYVTTSRGEAWGLGAFEAALVGNPVIAPAWGGFNDFLAGTYRYGVHVKCFETPVCDNGAQSVPGILTGEQRWAEPDLSQVQRAMRTMFESKAGKEPEAAERMSIYTYESVGKQFRDFLESISG